MKAIVQDEYGEAAAVMRSDKIDEPDVGAAEVLVEVVVAGVDRGAWHLTAGLPYPVRLAGYGVRAPKDPVRGREFAGRVAAVGSDVTTFGVGDEVYGVGEGCFAEYARAEVSKVVPKPKHLTFEQAAATPISALTALQAVRDQAKVQAGQKVLIIGASGGVGTFAVQIAKAFGAVVTAVCSTTKVDLVRSIGADHVIDYSTEDIGANRVRYDAVLDIGGGRSLTELRRLLEPKGTLVIVGSETGGRWLGGIDRQLRAVLLSPFVSQKLTMFVSSENAADLAAVSALIEAGQVTPVVDRVFPLNETAAAITYMRDGHARGKVVVTI
ncbi:NAD(P)-dependent alcohol dehydrogenase [Antrihabitans sp. YC3-6]|uniref:NAD(P)-dependent alcohol dehydrogenase n=1 Tax=Antrihabitans stalagmiti TaxID=2799499 RepID=A0A934NP99_9NOCA|nr:NAD(P)-dependent alcohol dehydrogenase [Antrihabitans stalagmiti]MBJ8338832.1 NAD(P)-dependent alcohol dehydrogenase [Antrihabitans stalagmiti]